MAKKKAARKPTGNQGAWPPDKPAPSVKRTTGKKSDKPGQQVMEGHEESKAPRAVEEAAKVLAERRRAKKTAGESYKDALSSMDEVMAKHGLDSFAGCGLEFAVNDTHKLVVKELKDK